MGDRIMRRLGPRSRKHRYVERNLRFAFPDRDQDWISATASSIWGQVGCCLGEYPHLATIGQKGPSSRIEVIDHADVHALLRGGQGVVFVAAHLGNWTIPAAVGNLLDFPLSVLYKRHKNTFVEASIEHWRNQLSAGFIDAGVSASKAMIAHLRKGHSIGLHIDHRTQYVEDVPFFGMDAPTSTIPARMAIKTGASFVPARVERLEHVRFRVTLYEPIPVPSAAVDSRDAARRMTEKANLALEGWIRERPDQWICTSNRWPRNIQAPEGVTAFEGSLASA